MNIHCLVFLLSILLRDAENAAKSALAQNPEEEIEAARAHSVLRHISVSETTQN